MDDQAPVNKAQSNGSGDSVVGSITGLGNDIATLAELQLKLFALDFKECASRALVPLSVTAAGLVVAIGSVPVLVGGAGLLLASALGISNGLGLLLAAVAAIVVAGACVPLGVRGVTRSLDALQRSREELQRNISWIRTVLVHSGRTPPRRRW